MSSQLHQIELGYHPAEDRLLLKIYTQDLSEFRFWLTRRFAGVLWDVLMKVLQVDQKSVLQHEQEMQKVTKAFDEEQARKQPMAQKFSNPVTKTPLGTDPLLAIKIAANLDQKGICHLRIESKAGQSIEIAANSYIVLSLCKLMSESVKKAEWNLQLKY